MSSERDGLDPNSSLLASLEEVVASRRGRRQNLLEHMDNLEKAEISCRHCPGTCCTFMGNTMQVTVLEAIDLYYDLVTKGQWDQVLVQRLKDCIREFRLDITPSTGRGVYMRKSYTCPFFGHQSLGCPIDPQVKPYGCLGFNASETREESGKSCYSDRKLLEERELLFEDEGNEEARALYWQERLKLPWKKESIPIALLELDQALRKLERPA